MTQARIQKSCARHQGAGPCGRANGQWTAPGAGWRDPGRCVRRAALVGTPAQPVVIAIPPGVAQRRLQVAVWHPEACQAQPQAAVVASFQLPLPGLLAHLPWRYSSRLSRTQTRVRPLPEPSRTSAASAFGSPGDRLRPCQGAGIVRQGAPHSGRSLPRGPPAPRDCTMVPAGLAATRAIASRQAAGSTLPRCPGRERWARLRTQTSTPCLLGSCDGLPALLKALLPQKQADRGSKLPRACGRAAPRPVAYSNAPSYPSLDRVCKHFGNGIRQRCGPGQAESRGPRDQRLADRVAPLALRTPERPAGSPPRSEGRRGSGTALRLEHSPSQAGLVLPTLQQPEQRAPQGELLRSRLAEWAPQRCRTSLGKGSLLQPGPRRHCRRASRHLAARMLASARTNRRAPSTPSCNRWTCSRSARLGGCSSMQRPSRECLCRVALVAAPSPRKRPASRLVAHCLREDNAEGPQARRVDNNVRPSALAAEPCVDSPAAGARRPCPRTAASRPPATLCRRMCRG